MYKEMLEKALKEGYDINKLFVAYICSQNISVDDPDYEEVCRDTYEMFKEDEKEGVVS